MKILIISDLHVGEKARTKDLCPYPVGENKDTFLVPSFLESIKIENEKGLIDYVVIPGDIADKSSASEYKCFSDFIDKLHIELNLNIDKFLFIPGNHDANWECFKDALTDEQVRIAKLQQYDNIKDSRIHKLGNWISKELFEEPYFDIKIFENAIFVLCNSSWHNNPQAKNKYGTIETEHLAILRSRLDIINKDHYGKLKFFIVHHHPFQYPKTHPAWNDFSCLQNSGELLHMLSEFSFDFIIHGHKHTPFFYPLELSNLPKINLFCSGSYSHEIPTEIAGKVSNLYHIIEFNDVIKKQGVVYSKAYDPIEKKWVNSAIHHGIEFMDRFGCSLKMEVLLGICKTVMTELLGKQDIIKLEDLYRECEDLKYLPNRAKQKLITDIEKELEVKFATASNNVEFFAKI